MLEELKQVVQKSQQRLDQIRDKLEDEVEDLSDDAVELWQKTKPKLQQMQSSLNRAASALQVQTEEARLQAHLVIMDAHDQWQHLGKTVKELARHSAEKGAYKLQRADLQAHLAAMETRDFIDQHGAEIRRDFEKARDKVEKASSAAAKEMEASLEKMGNIWARMK